MVTGNPLYAYPQSHLSPLGSIDEEEDEVLDESILDDLHPTDMASQPFSPHHPFYAHPQFLPHEEEAWPPCAMQYPASPFGAVGNSSAGPPTTQSALAHDPSNSYPMYGEHPAPWHPVNVGMRSMGEHQNTMATPFGIKTEESAGASSMPPPTAAGSTTLPEQMPRGPSVASPQSENGWLSASSASDRSNRAAQRDETHRSFASFPSHLRRDGIRKKNARVEIPDGRTIDTIEEEIKMCDPNDEAKLKELKQYKRLLRNREAALSSRSRKKEHALRLEEENKILNAREEELKMKETYWIHECQKLTQAIEKCVAKEEDLVRRHTLETAELRKKISFLTEEMQQRSSVSLPGNAPPAGFPSNFGEFDGMSLNGQPHWEHFSFNGGNNNHTANHAQKSQEMAVSPQQKEAKPVVKEDEPAVSGLLLMLLLCGAWVASSSGTTKQVTVPEMSEDVRAASAAVLTNIYKDAGLQPQTGATPTFDGTTSFAPAASQPAVSGFGSSPFDGQNFHQLTEATRQQQQEQAFSLTTDQYNHITTDWYGDRPQTASPVRKRNLADALANLHLNRRMSATDAYTKSLLVDEVPANVVRDFHRMLAERNKAPAQDDNPR